MRYRTITEYKNTGSLLWLTLLLILFIAVIRGEIKAETNITSNISRETIQRVTDHLSETHGSKHQFRIQRGVNQAASFWRESDGSETDFENFCKKYFIPEPDQLSQTLKRIEENFETLRGYFLRIYRDLDRPLTVERTSNGHLLTILPLDHLFAEYSPSGHLEEDLFKTKAAFAIILNFPRYTLEEKLEQGSSWNREQWVEAAAGDIFTSRVPSETNQKHYKIMSDLYTNYHDRYFIYLGKLLTNQNKTLFPPDLKSFVHFSIREQLRAGYTGPGGQEKQEIIYQVMLRVVDQTIPRIVVDNPDVYWNPVKNQVFQKKGNRFIKIKAAPEGGIRYQYWQSAFKAQQLLDPYYPGFPGLIQRSAGTWRKIPNKVVEDLLISVLTSPLTKRVGQLIEKRLGRILRPYDIWYNGFKTGSRELPREKLDRIVKEKYPDAASFQKDIPVFLKKFGFTPERAAFIAGKIIVEAARAAGHAMAPLMRSDNAYLRSEFPPGGMNYPGFIFALHEMGHNIEQVCSLHMIDRYLLHGVPNTAISESFAYMFGNRALEFLGMEKYRIIDPLKTLDAFWFTYKTSGVALVDIKAWEWMYQHPSASASQFQEAVIRIAKDVWNQYYAPVFKERDVPILLIYSHLLGGVLYFPDYPIGQIIGFQLETYMEGRNSGVEMERMCKIGNLPPGIWMQQAVGEAISADPLLQAAEKALDSVNK